MKKLQILGTGCPTCAKLAEMVEDAAQGLDIDYELEKVTDIDRITAFGVMSTPALAVDGEVKFSGGLRTADELKAMIRKPPIPSRVNER
ncbi:MAG: thioredoxin family protein [Candidatus Hydrogenedentes bacterium]|jgi:small redox-active disulfide protein 2|nr:thioredoxin family protein [Candidatus Hydrogenedentota bacterium]